MDLDLNDPNCLGVNDLYPPATEWPTDPDEVPFRTRLILYGVAAGALGLLLVLAFWWVPAAFIFGGIVGIVFSLRVKLDIRPQWPM